MTGLLDTEPKTFAIAAGTLVGLLVASGLVLVLGVPIENFVPQLAEASAQSFERAFRLLTILILVVFGALIYGLVSLARNVRALRREWELFSRTHSALREEVDALQDIFEAYEREARDRHAEIQEALASERRMTRRQVRAYLDDLDTRVDRLAPENGDRTEEVRP